MLLRVMAYYADRAAHGRDLTGRVRGEREFNRLLTELREWLAETRL